jgi:integrase
MTENTAISYLVAERGKPQHRNGCLCSDHRMAPSTMWVWYSAVRWYHRMGDPPLPWEMGNRLRLAMKGYAQEMVDAGWAPARAPRAYPEDVRAWVDALDPTIEKHVQAAVVLLAGWYTAARAGDLVTYRISDVHWTRIAAGEGVSVPGVDLQLRSSKANKQPGKVVEHRAFAANLADPRYCGVAALRTLIDLRAARHGVTSGALLLPFRPGAKEDADVILQPDPGFKLSTESINRVIKGAARRAGYPNWKDYSEHSLRRGRAQWLYENGIRELEIGRHHGWADKGSLRDYLAESDRLSPTAPGSVGML